MKTELLKKLIKEAVKEAIQEELKEVLLEAVKAPKLQLPNLFRKIKQSLQQLHHLYPKQIEDSLT